MHRTLALLLLACTPVLAQDAKPLHQADTQTLAPTPREQLLARIAKLSKELPATRKLVTPTRGKVRLGIVLVELADAPRPSWGKQAWQDMLFSKGTYTRDPDGRPAFGSVHDYYTEQSGSQIDLDGKVFDWVSIPAKRADFERTGFASVLADRLLYGAALDRLLAREGKAALDDVDALGFIVSGPASRQWGSTLWPHSGAIVHAGKAWRYYLDHAGDTAFEPIGVHAHEIGHVLGLPDEYGLGHSGGSGVWCLMATGNGGGWDNWVQTGTPPVTARDGIREVFHDQLQNMVEQLFGKRTQSELFCLQLDAPPLTAARPLHICAPCKAALGWVRPVSPKPGQRLFLEPVEDHFSQVIALPLGGSKRLILEYRGRRGFDEGLPRSGLLAWETTDLVEGFEKTLAIGANGALVPAHGISSVDAAHRDGVPWPWKGHASIERGAVRVERIEEKDGKVYLEVAR